MPISERSDPVRGFNFEIALFESAHGSAGALASVSLSALMERPAAGFSECTGLEMTLDMAEYEAGGNNTTVLQFPTRMKWSPVVLKRGVGNGTDLWDWFYSFVEGEGTRRDGVITLRNERHEPHTVWGFRRGLPLKWTGPTMNASRAEVAIEAIEIRHEGLYLMQGAGVLTQAVQSIAGLVGG